MQEYDVIFTPDAVEELYNIGSYIVENGGDANTAVRYTEKLRESCHKLKIWPIRGNSRDNIRNNLRIYPLDKKAVAAFEVDEDLHIVRILGIYYGGRDYESLLR